MAKHKRSKAVPSFPMLAADEDSESLIDDTETEIEDSEGDTEIEDSIGVTEIQDSEGDTEMEDSIGDTETPLIDLSGGEDWHVPDSAKTAKNGWIEIHETQDRPYDYDKDPAGLYGGREVDKRPSLIDFYHQDARTKQIFARMVPAKNELPADSAALLEAVKLERVRQKAELREEAEEKAAAEAAKTRAGREAEAHDEELFGIPELRRQYSRSTLDRQRGAEAHNEELFGMPELRRQQSRSTYHLDENQGTFQQLLDAASAVESKGKAKDRSYDVFEYLAHSVQNTSQIEDKDLQKAIGASFKQDKMGHQTRLAPPTQEDEDAALEEAIRASKESAQMGKLELQRAPGEFQANQTHLAPPTQEDEDAQLEKAIRASKESAQMEKLELQQALREFQANEGNASPKRKREENDDENYDDIFLEASDDGFCNCEDECRCAKGKPVPLRPKKVRRSNRNIKISS